ncbi:hypothetical protein C8R45DRAFT_928960 [Mycena sanguinolenta]|nr:hypothetical protein C8R45DRAFT_928960 [Mycena sanguinolenta]
MRRSVKADQTLTATHDTAAAWAGIGSATSCLWNQRIVPASAGDVLLIFMYLGSILALHITTPALFSVETFNATRLDQVRTQGLPAYSWPSDLSPGSNGNQLRAYTGHSLSFFPSIVESAAETGLSGGTLYDVLDANTAIGNVTVNATGFNITCGYVNNVTQKFSSPVWLMQEGSSLYQITPTACGVISSELNVFFTQPVVLYSTIPIIDSDNKVGVSIELSPPMDTSVAAIQLLRHPQNFSSWAPYPGPFDGPKDSDDFSLSISSMGGNLLLDAWGLWYPYLPLIDIDISHANDDIDNTLLNTGDAYLIQKLNLFPTDSGPPRRNVTLHELENALSDIVASMFWTLSCKPVGAPSSLNISIVNESLVRYPDVNQSIPGPFLLDGFAEVTSNFPLGRLDLSIIAVPLNLTVTAGLTASILLLLLSLPHSRFPGRPTSNDNDIQIDGTDILQAIWLYWNHPELETLLEQVDHPTTDNLHWAGEVRTRLVATRKKRPSVPESGFREEIWPGIIQLASALFFTSAFDTGRPAFYSRRTQGLPAYTWPSDLSPVSNGNQLGSYVSTSLAFFPSVIEMEGCRIVEAVNTRVVGQTKPRVAKNDRTIVWSFKRATIEGVYGGQDQEEKICNYRTVTINV